MTKLLLQSRETTRTGVVQVGWKKVRFVKAVHPLHDHAFAKDFFAFCDVNALSFLRDFYVACTDWYLGQSQLGMRQLKKILVGGGVLKNKDKVCYRDCS